jgi:predicted small lipoprotein YifL
VIRHLIVAMGLLAALSACGQRQELPAPAAEPKTAPVTQSESEADPVVASFASILELRGVTFSVTSPNGPGRNTVSVTTKGLGEDNSDWSQQIDGIVTGAEVADLNVNGSPEIYIYVRSHAADAKGSVVAYVANNRKSLSMAFMPPLEDSPGAAEGYRGDDEFAVLEGVLGRRFPIHDEAGARTGRTRQLQYALKAGEAGWLLKVDKQMEF